jgi:hypothetical protein
MTSVTKNRTYSKIAGFWVITQKLLILTWPFGPGELKKGMMSWGTQYDI